MRNLLKILTVAVASVMPMAAHAADFPTKPVMIVVPYPPGGNVDSAARIIAPKMGEVLGQPVVIQNRAGAGGMIAAQYVMGANADGYTLFMAANGPLLFAPMTMKRPDVYDWKKDFAPIGAVSITPMVLSVRADLHIDSLQKLLDQVDSKGLLMASPGAGTTNHLAAELMMEKSGKQWRIVQYKGNAPAVTSLLGGETAFSFDQISVILPHIKEGVVVPLVVTSDERVPTLPDVPTFKEASKLGFQAVTFTGLLAPAKTPDDVINAISKALTVALSDKGVQKQFADLGSLTKVTTPAEFKSFLGEIDDTWRPVVQKVDTGR